MIMMEVMKMMMMVVMMTMMYPLDRVMVQTTWCNSGQILLTMPAL